MLEFADAVPKRGEPPRLEHEALGQVRGQRDRVLRRVHDLVQPQGDSHVQLVQLLLLLQLKYEQNQNVSVVTGEQSQRNGESDMQE